jgi:hypothetical protein
MAYFKNNMTDIDFKSPDFSEEALNCNQFLLLGYSQGITIDGVIRKKANNEFLSTLCQGAADLFDKADK